MVLIPVLVRCLFGSYLSWHLVGRKCCKDRGRNGRRTSIEMQFRRCWTIRLLQTGEMNRACVPSDGTCPEGPTVAVYAVCLHCSSIPSDRQRRPRFNNEEASLDLSRLRQTGETVESEGFIIQSDARWKGTMDFNIPTDTWGPHPKSATVSPSHSLLSTRAYSLFPFPFW